MASALRERHPKAVLANDLLTGKTHMTEVEHNTFMLLVSTIRMETKLDMETWYEFDIETYAELAGVSRSVAYEATKLASKKLLHQTCVIKTDTSTVLVNLVTAIKLEDGKIQATFHKELFPYISELVNRFTSIDVRTIFLLRKPQLKNLYSLVSSDKWKADNTRFYELEELYEMLDVPVSYRNYKEFNKHVLKRGKEEFEKLGLGGLKVEVRKVGRKVVAVRFGLGGL